MDDFPMILDCYRSEQISELQWQEHLKDDEFRAWLAEHAPQVLECPA